MSLPFDFSEYDRAESEREHAFIAACRYRNRVTGEILMVTRFVADKNGDPENFGYAKGSTIGIGIDFMASIFDLLSRTRHYSDKIQAVGQATATTIITQYDRAFPGDVWMDVESSLKRMADEIGRLRQEVEANGKYVRRLQEQELSYPIFDEQDKEDVYSALKDNIAALERIPYGELSEDGIATLENLKLLAERMKSMKAFTPEKRHMIYSALRSFQKTGVYSSADEREQADMLDELVDWANGL